MNKDLFSKKWFIVFTLISLLFFQLIYSFLFPAYGFNNDWQPITTYLPKFQVGLIDNLISEKIFPLISSEYRLNSDAGGYLELARNFTPEYFDGHNYLNRPLYPFLIFLLSIPVGFFIPLSYGIIFGLAVLLNFILATLAVYLFFQLIKKLFSLQTAWLSSVLLIFSPLVHIQLIQPGAEMITIFMIVLSLYLLHNYISRSSRFKLIAFSLMVGVLLLAKMFFAISFFILLLAIYFKRYKEGSIFLIVHLIPIFLWYLWVTQVWQISYFINEVQNWHMGVWLFNVFYWSWTETARILLSAIPNFIKAVIYSFLLIPVIFSVIGFKFLPFKSKNIIYFGSFSSLFILGFIINLYLYRHAFILFPIIYPTAVLGMERTALWLKRYRFWYAAVFYAIIIGLIILISNSNIYQIFDYNDHPL